MIAAVVIRRSMTSAFSKTPLFTSQLSMPSCIMFAVVQAEQQLGPGWTLMRSGTPKCPEIQDWLASTLPQGGRVGIDPFLHTVSLPLSVTLILALIWSMLFCPALLCLLLP